jgi:hypothetical protein
MMALGAAGKQARLFHIAGSPKDELVRMSSAEWTGFSPNLPSNRADLAKLLLHREILLLENSGAFLLNRTRHCGLTTSSEWEHRPRASALKIPWR